MPDPDTGAAVPLFDPRAQVWSDHFTWDGHRMVGLTPTGRATVAALNLNHPRRVRIREAEAYFALFPPDEAT